MNTDSTEPDPSPSTEPYSPADDLTRTRKQSFGDIPTPTAPQFSSGPAFDPPDEPPTVCGRFHSFRWFRDGGMGRVFLARDAELSREVAFKWMKDRSAAHPQAVELFVREAELTGRLEHPGIAPVYGFGHSGEGRPFYAMRVLRGPTLAEEIEAFHSGGPKRTLTAEEALNLRRLLGRFLSICQTIAFAHSNGIIHRDLKPGNVVLGSFGETVVLDWGLARAESGPFEPPGVQLGTPAFWAPEQQQGQPDAHDRRTDVYGLGGILYALLCGRAPNHHGCCPPTPPLPSAICPWVDNDLNRIVTTALARESADRYPSAESLTTEVERWLADQPASAQKSVVAELRLRLASESDNRALAEQLARQVANLGLVLAGMTRDLDAANSFSEAADRFAGLNQKTARARYQVEEANARVNRMRILERLGFIEEAAREQALAAAIYEQLSEREPGKYKAFATLILPPKEVPPAPIARSDHATWIVPPQVEPPEAPLFADDINTEEDSIVAESLPSVVPVEDMSATVVPDEGPAGDTIAPPPGYKLIQTLGQGGMGTVYLAHDEALDRLVAIKELSAVVADRPAFLARFLREARALAGLRHANIMAVYAYGVRSGTGHPYLVTEYIEGDQVARLAQRFHEAGGRPAHGEHLFEGLLQVYAQAADALHYAHRKGIIHRDPKPQNIMVRPDGSAVVLDWGLALVLGTPDSPGEGPAPEDAFSTAAGTVMGTPAFISPEQAIDATKVDARSDVYVLGAGLYYVLTGRPIFQGNLSEILAMVVEGKVPRPSSIRPDVPAELDAICTKAMAHKPENRYQSAAEFAAALRNWLNAPVSTGWWSRLFGR